MQPAREYSPLRSDLAPLAGRQRPERATARVDLVVLQVDGVVSRLNGLAWLMERRDAATLTRLAEVHAEAAESKWSWADTARARLALLRPRRAEIYELRQAYLAALVPGATDAAHRIRRAGIGVALASEVAAESLLGLADALGVSTSDLRAPRLRFDALGAYVGCDASDATAPTERAARTHALLLGTRPSVWLAAGERDEFATFTGVVAREGIVPTGDTIGSFAELTERLGV